MRPSSARKRGDDVGKTKVGKGMKLEIVIDASGLPLGMATGAADESEQDLLVPALNDIPIDLPQGTPVIADKGHDSDSLRDQVEQAGFRADDPASQQPGEAVAQRRSAAAALSPPMAGRTNERLASLLPRPRCPLVALLVHVRRAGVSELHPHGATTVLKQSLSKMQLTTLICAPVPH